MLHVLAVLPDDDGLPVDDVDSAFHESVWNHVRQAKIVDVSQEQEAQSDGRDDVPLDLGEEWRALSWPDERCDYDESAE